MSITTLTAPALSAAAGMLNGYMERTRRLTGKRPSADEAIAMAMREPETVAELAYEQSLLDCPVKEDVAPLADELARRHYSRHAIDEAVIYYRQNGSLVGRPIFAFGDEADELACEELLPNDAYLWSDSRWDSIAIGVGEDLRDDVTDLSAIKIDDRPLSLVLLTEAGR